MDTKKEQMKLMHNICQKELNELQISMERYLDGSERIQKLLYSRSLALDCGAPLAGRRGVNNVFNLIAFDRYMTQMSTVISMTRKFNIHLQLNGLQKTVLDPTETFDPPLLGINSAQSHVPQTRFLQDYIQWSNSSLELNYEKDSPNGSRTLDGSDGLSPERKAIEQPTKAEAKVNNLTNINEKTNHAVQFKYSDLDTFLLSMLPVKDLSHFTEGHTFSASITYVKDYTNLVFFICEMDDCRKLFEISCSQDVTPINQLPLSSHVVFGITQDEIDCGCDTKSVWRAVKLPEELGEKRDSVVLIDFGEIIQLTEQCQLYSITPNFRKFPPLAIKCILKGVCDTDGIVTNDHGKCEAALSSNEFKMVKFRVLNLESRVLHLAILMEEKKDSEEKSVVCDLNMTPQTNPFLDSLLLEEDAELEETGDPLYLPISTVYGHTPRMGPNSNITPKIGDHLLVTVTHVNSPISFYATIENKFQEISEVFFWNDDELLPAQKTISPPKLNDILLAQYSKDEHWYRAQLVEILPKEKQYKVFYIDFGNTEIVSLNALAACKPDLLNRSSKAIPFCLADLKLINSSEPLHKSFYGDDICDIISTQNLRKATESVVVIILDQTISVEVTGRRGNELVVRFLDDQYKCIPSMLLDMGVVAKT